MADMITSNMVPDQIKSTVKGWFSPFMWSIVSVIGLFIWNKFDLGDNPTVKNGLSQLGGTFSKIQEGFQSFLRGILNKELNTARDDIMNRPEAFNGVEGIDKDFGTSGISDRVKELSKRSIDNAFGYAQMSNPQEILASMQELRGDIAATIVSGLKEKNKNYTADDEKRYTEAAQARAAAITGVTDEVGNNANILSTGLGGLLNQFHKAVEPKGDYVKGSAKNAPIDNALIEQARTLVSSNIKSGSAAVAAPPAAAGAAAGRQ